MTFSVIFNDVGTAPTIIEIVALVGSVEQDVPGPTEE